MWSENLKKKIFQSTLLLIVLSAISKILSFGVRIYLGRKLNSEAMGYYSLAMPTLVFLIALAQMGIPSALSKVIAQKEKPYISIMASLILSVVNNTCLILIFLFFIPRLSVMIFQRGDMELLLKAMIAMIPMVTLSGILKGILQGQQHHATACASQIFEEIFRIIYLILFFQNGFISPLHLAQGAMFSIFIGECGSTLFMLIVMYWDKKPMKYDHEVLKIHHFSEILELSIPMTSARFIGSFTYFIEPMIFLAFAVNASSMSEAYGILNGYVMPLITMPSFISVTLASALLPSFTYEFSHGHIAKAKKIFYVIFSVCLSIGVVCSLICFLFANELLTLFYGNPQGASFLRMLSIPFMIYSLQPVLSSVLHALNRSKRALFDTLMGCILRLAILFFFTVIFHELTLIYALCSGMVLTTLLHGFHVIAAFWELR